MLMTINIRDVQKDFDDCLFLYYLLKTYKMVVHAKVIGFWPWSFYSRTYKCGP